MDSDSLVERSVSLCASASSNGECTHNDHRKNVENKVSDGDKSLSTPVVGLKLDMEESTAGEIEMEHSKSSDQQALQDVGNKVGDMDIMDVIVPKKSLLKRAKNDLDLTTCGNSSGMKPAKRLRIVEANLNYIQSINNESECPEDFVGADDMATVKEVISCGETLRWLNSPSSSVDQSCINVDFVRDNLIPLKRVFSVEIDMRFILTQTCTAILGCKKNIAEVGAYTFHEWIAHNCMHNCAAFKTISFKENFLKLANLDALLDEQLSVPLELTSEPASAETEDNVYYVGDLWQNSKGFREYMLSRTSQHEQKFSTKILTMRTSGPCFTEVDVTKRTGLLFPEKTAVDDQIDLAHLSTENVEAYLSCTEYCDLLNFETVDKFSKFVQSRTKGKGLHTFIVDNTEVSYVYESCREIRLHKYLYCECLLALRCVREGGTFICKIFDTFTTFTNGILFLLYKCFKNIAIHKPSSSSSCTSERFIICRDKIDNVDSKYVIDFLTECLDMVVNNQEQRKIVRRRARKRLQVVKMEVQRLVPLRIILSHAEFFQFVRESNIRLTTELAESIDKLCESLQKKNLGSVNGLQKVHQQILSLSDVPTDLHNTSKDDPAIQVATFFARNSLSSDVCVSRHLKLEVERLKQEELVALPVQAQLNGNVYRSCHGWFFGCGGSKILHLKGNVWTQLEQTEFLLPNRTLVFGEIVEEIRFVQRRWKYVKCFHLMDSAYVRGTYIGSLSMKNRQGIVKRLVSTLKNEGGRQKITITSFLNMNQMFHFYQSTATTTDLLGYGKHTRCQLRMPIGEGKPHKILVDAFLIMKNIQETSPEAFFKKFQHFLVKWELEEDNMKSVLENLKSK